MGWPESAGRSYNWIRLQAMCSCFATEGLRPSRYSSPQKLDHVLSVNVQYSAFAVSVQHTLCGSGRVDQSADVIDGEVREKETVDKRPIFCRQASR
jgi:hypothetical protein